MTAFLTRCTAVAVLRDREDILDTVLATLFAVGKVHFA